MNVVILGRPGAGKGTQAKRIASVSGLRHLSTGDLLRAATTSNSPLGESIAKLIDNGNFVTDEMAIELVEEAIVSSSGSGRLFDGIPRTIAQSQMLDDLLASFGETIDLAIELAVPEKLAKTRLIERAKLEGRRDDNEETIRHRMKVYEAETAPLINHYRQRSLLKSVDGSGTPDEVFELVKLSCGDAIRL